MKKKFISKITWLTISLLLAVILLAGCVSLKVNRRIQTPGFDADGVRVWLYGEKHGQKHIMDAELAAWQDCYHNKGMRHLFVEKPYAAAAFLNQWMHEGNDDILLQLYADTEGTQGHVEAALDFYRAIKATCPETVFHGTDVGHQYFSTGERYLQQLEAQGLKDSEAYRLTEENCNQAIEYYSTNNDGLRENCMVANFIRELDFLPPDTKVMGIYGSQHTCYELDWSKQVPSMISQLITHYGSIFHAEDLSKL